MGGREIIVAAVEAGYTHDRAFSWVADRAIERLTAAGYRILGPGFEHQVGARVTKISGSSWTGRVVGFYSTALTPVGYAVESENEPGSVQIYPASALRSMSGRSNDR